MIKPSIAIKLSQRDYKGIVALGNRVIVSMTGSGLFLVPSPSISALQTAVSEVEAGIALHGDSHNHGTTENMRDLRQKTVTLYNLLTAEAGYVTNVCQLACGEDYIAMAAMMTAAGYGLKSQPNPQGLLQPVRNFHRLVDLALNPNMVKMIWETPENVTSKNNVKSYLVFKGTTPVFASATQVAITTKGEFTDTNDSGTMVTFYYWIVAISSAGSGAVSDVLGVTLLPM